MGKLQNLIKPERIQDAEYTEVMSESYVSYALSVIVSRAIPDVRDGLKPVHRRFIYDMNEQGFTHDKPYKKCASTVGDTLGKYHPHGDLAVYDAMVVAAQPWKKMVPLVDSHGNFGSIEGDSAAAYRYTESRLHRFTEDIFLEDLKYDVVDMVPNYDNSRKEPEALPCKLPHVLINGAEGIAVGMTTSIPSHNTSEVIDAAIAYLKGNHDVSKLMKILPGPDFPTGGIISNASDIKSIYDTGRGRIKIRGRFQYEKGTMGERDRLVITEIPYTMIGEGIKKFLQDTADLVENKTLPEIYDIINQCSGDSIRIVLELRPNANIERIQNVLYKKTKLEDTFGVNMLVIDHGTPVVMNLLQLMDSFEKFQYQIYTRKFQKLLAKAEKKREVNEGLIRAIDLIDVIIAVLRSCKDDVKARNCLMTGNLDGITLKTKALESAASKFRFTEIQTDAILAMPLSRLIGLESDAILAERNKLDASIATYRNLLSNPNEMRKEIIKFLQDAKKRYGVDRRTTLDNVDTPDVSEIEAPEVELTVLVDKFNYIMAIERSAYSRNREYIEETFPHIINISSRDKIAIFTQNGKVHLIPMKEVPLKKPRDKGVPLDNISQFDYKTERIVGIEALGFKKEEKLFVFATSQGSIKMTRNSEFFINRKVTDSTLLKEKDEVFKVFLYQPKGVIVFETEKGFVLKENQDNIKTKSKYSQGVQGIKLGTHDALKLVTTDGTAYADVRKGQFGTTGKIRTKKLI